MTQRSEIYAADIDRANNGFRSAILYYTDNTLDDTPLNNAALATILAAGRPVLAVSREPVRFVPPRWNWVIPGPRGLDQLLTQIMTGLSALHHIGCEQVYLAEHDVIYSPNHFALTIPGERAVMAANVNVWRLHATGWYRRPADQFVLSSMFGSPGALLNSFCRIAQQPNPKLIEPGRGTPDPVALVQAPAPNIDVRHGGNFSRWLPRGRRKTNIPPWGHYKTFRKELGLCSPLTGSL